MAPIPAVDLEELSLLVDKAVLLISDIETSLKDVVDSNGDSGPSADKWTSATSLDDRDQLDSLALARDATTLLKAHATKVSLFIINEPYTPSAISAILKQLIDSVIPAVGFAVKHCHADLYTKLFRRDLAWNCGRVLKELRELIAMIPKDGKVLPQKQRNGLSHATGDKGSVVNTGLLWGACDDVIEVANLGAAAHLVKRAELFRNQLVDVLEELKEWAEEQDEVDDEGDEDADDDGQDQDQVGDLADDMQNTHISTQAMLDSYMNSSRNIPRDDPDKIRERLDSTIRRLRLTIILYQALLKRRLKTLPELPLASAGAESVVVSRLDAVLPLLKRIAGRFDELTIAFYELHSYEITKLMDLCFFDAFAVSELLAKPWVGQKDEFTDWVAKFQVQIKQN